MSPISTIMLDIPEALKLSIRYLYHTRAIITRGLYTFYPLFEVYLCTVNFCFMSRAGYSGAHTVDKIGIYVL